MPRRDLTEERTAQILDAFERCVARSGIDGTSLEMIAEEADMKRSILRHYVGNREELVHALARRVVAKYRTMTDAMVESLPAKKRLEAMLGMFFPTENEGSAADVLVIEHFIAAADTDETIRELVTGWVDHLLEAIVTEIRDEYPKTPKKKGFEIAYGIVSIYFNYGSLLSLGFPDTHRRAALACCRELIASLPR